MTSHLNLKMTLAIKLKHRRKARRLTLDGLARLSRVSTSYLAEIEAGKKFPRPERILQIAEALGCSYEELISSKLEGEFDELRSFLISPGVREFPFEMFGVPAGDVMRLVTRSPHEIAALLRALNDFAWQYDIRLDHVLHAALRSYQELTGNYYEAIEQEAEAFAGSLGSRGKSPWDDDTLRTWVTNNCARTIDECTLGERPALRGFRAVLATEPHPRLFLSPGLTQSQKAFVLAREAGHHVLGLKARSRSLPPHREDSFEQVLNDFKASYFAGALLLPRQSVTSDLKAFFRLPAWRPQVLLRLLEKYRVTPDTLMYRLSQLVPSQFGLRAYFFEFRDEGGSLHLVKQLNLSDVQVPVEIRAHEHYCRRRLSTRLVVELARVKRRRPGKAMPPLAEAQYSQFVGGEDRFFSIGLAVPEPLRPDVGTSFTLAFPADETLFKTIRFAKDPAIPHAIINSTCERCSLGPEACSDRAAPPILHKQSLLRAERQRELEALGEGAP